MIFKLTMLHVVLDRQKISNTILERHFSFFCGVFFLEIGHIGYQKIKTFKLISKKQTCLSDKMPPKKVKIFLTERIVYF